MWHQRLWRCEWQVRARVKRLTVPKKVCDGAYPRLMSNATLPVVSSQWGVPWHTGEMHGPGGILTRWCLKSWTTSNYSFLCQGAAGGLCIKLLYLPVPRILQERTTDTESKCNFWFRFNDIDSNYHLKFWRMNVFAVIWRAGHPDVLYWYFEQFVEYF